MPVWLAIAPLLLLLPTSGGADVVRLDFTGTATLTTGIFADEVVPDDLVTGSVFVSLDFVDFRIADGLPPLPNQSEYVPSDAPVLDGVWELSVQYGTESRSTVDNTKQAGVDHHRLIISDAEDNPFGPDDAVSYSALSTGNGDDTGILSLAGDDFVASGPPALDGVLTFALLDALVPQPTAFPTTSGYVARNASNLEIGRLEWQVETLSATLIPTPPVVPAMGGWLRMTLLAGLACAGALRLRSTGRAGPSPRR